MVGEGHHYYTAPEGNPANFLSLQLYTTQRDGSAWQGDYSTKYIPHLRGIVPVPYTTHKKKFCQAVKHFDRLKLSQFATISRG